MCLEFSLDNHPRCNAAFFEADFCNKCVKLQSTIVFTKPILLFFLCCLKQAHIAEEFLKKFFEIGPVVSFN